MANRKISLKTQAGFTLIELIIGITIILILIVMAVLLLNPIAQVSKAEDSKKKTDLKRIQIAWEDYYNDHNCYPTGVPACAEPFIPYLDQFPCDSRGENYNYYPEDIACPQEYRFYVKLQNIKDMDIEKVNCQNGCGPGGSSLYNYGISSANVGLEPGSGSQPTSPPTAPTSVLPTPTLVTPTHVPVGDYFGCFNFVCTPLEGPICSPNYQVSNCYNQCPNPLNECR